MEKQIPRTLSSWKFKNEYSWFEFKIVIIRGWEELGRRMRGSQIMGASVQCSEGDRFWYSTVLVAGWPEFNHTLY